MKSVPIDEFPAAGLDGGLIDSLVDRGATAGNGSPCRFPIGDGKPNSADRGNLSLTFAEIHRPTDMTAAFESNGRDIECLQLGHGPFRTLFATTRMRKLAVQVLRSNRRMHLYGAGNDSNASITLVVSGSGQFLGHHFRPGDVLCLQPNEEFDLIAPPGFECLMLHAEVEQVTELAGPLYQVGASIRAAQVVRPRVGVRDEASRILQEVFNGVHNRKIPQELVKHLLRLFVKALSEPNAAGKAGISTPIAAQHTNCARRFIEQNLLNEISVENIAKETRVSVRMIQHCFNTVFEMTPTAYLRARRLHAVQSLLLQASPRSTTVSEVAGRFNFSHFGRFSAYYRSLFGELPKDTLRQNGQWPR